jgi:hypothetical protein
MATDPWAEFNPQASSQGTVIRTSPADPTLPYQGDKAAADATSAQAGAAVDAATVQPQINKITAEANRAALAGKTEGLPEGYMWDATGNSAVPIPGYVPKQSATEADAAAKKDAQSRKTAVIRSIMGEVINQYKQGLRGQPLSRLFGATEYIDALPTNESFSSTAEGMLGLIRPIVAQSAKEGDSDREMAAFLAYIPNANDTDRTVESKLRNLERLISGVVDGKLPSQMVKSGSLASDSDTPFVDSALNDKPLAINPTGGNTPPSGGSDLTQRVPGTGGTQMQPAQGESYSTPEDMAIAAEMDRVYRSGGSVQDMIAVSQRYNRPTDLSTVSQWQRAIDFRDGTGEFKGKARGFSPVETPSSGRRNLAERALGSLASSGPGALAISAADQWAGGGGLDEVVGTVNSLVKGTDRDAEIAYANMGKQAVRAENPVWSLAGGLAGGFGQGAALGKFLPDAASALTSGAGRIAGTGLGYGATSGALESNDDRVGGGLVGGGLGMFGGLAGRYVAAPALDAITRRVSRDPNIPRFAPGERAIPSIDALPDVRRNLEDANRLGLPYSLADADPKLRMLAGSVSRKSPDARGLAEETFDARSLGQAERAYDAIDTHLAPVTDLQERAAQWRQAANTASGPLYAMGRQRAAPVDPRVSAFLETPAGKSALNDARTLAGNEGRDPNSLGFDLNDQGEVVLRELPSWETLDYIKRGFDQQLSPYRDQFSGKLNLEGNPAAQSIDGLRRRFLQTLDELNPDYADARKAYSEQIANRDALNRGAKGTQPKIKPRDLERVASELTPQQLGEFRRGYATSMADQVYDTRLAANPYDRIYGGTSQKMKVDTLFPDGSSNFRRIYDLERDMAKTRQETIGGSATAPRLAADQMFDSPIGMAIDAGTQLATGGGFSPASALKLGAQMLGDNWRLGLGRKRADQMAPVLFDTDPKKTLDYLDNLSARQAIDSQRKERLSRRLGMFGALGVPTVANSLVVPVGP